MRYAGKYLIIKLEVLNRLLNIKLKREEQMGDHIASMETKFLRLASKNDPVSVSMRVALLVSSLSDLPKCIAITASTSTMNGNEASCSYVSKTFIQEEEAQKIHNRSVKGMDVNVETLAT